MRKMLLLCFCFAGLAAAFGQDKMNTNKWRKSERDSMSRGQLLYEEQNFLMALPIFEKLMLNHPNENYLKYVTGMCGLYRSDKHEQALQLLTEVYEKNRKIAEIEFDLARANHLNYKFDEALKLLRSYKGKAKNITPKRQTEIEHLEKYCNNGKAMLANPLPARIENIGAPVNTAASEYVPVISSDESVMIFTYRGELSTGGLQNAFNQPDPYGIYYEDVFMSFKDNGQWMKPEGIKSINTDINDAAIAISGDGQKLFVFRDNGTDGGDIYMSTLMGTDWQAPVKLAGDVNSLAWEGSCSLSSDEKTLYFSSERAGGLGGKDIYKATLQADGSWGNAVNMGDKINTPYDDDAPFIHPDGQSLLFSSKGNNSMGGYDIFRSTLNLADSTWGNPESLGYPINTPDDDIYYVLSANGKRGYYASGKSDGMGLQDIYTVEPGISGKRPFAVLVRGTVSAKNAPVEAEIVVEIASANKIFRTFKTNATSGFYLSTMPGGQKYKLTYKHAGYADQVREFDASASTEYFEKTINVDFSEMAAAPKKDSSVAASIPVQSGPAKTGNESVEGLIYRVQIAAYRLPKNYDYNRLKSLGKVEEQEVDGIARFTIGGEFNNINAASEHCKKVRAAGQNDAFVTALYKGKRVYLADLEKYGIIPKR